MDFIIEDLIQKEELIKENQILKKTIKMILERTEKESCYYCPLPIERKECKECEDTDECHEKIMTYYYVKAKKEILQNER